MTDEKQIAVRMEKVQDFPNSDDAKYAFLAYFKEAEAAKNQLMNTIVDKSVPLTLSQRVAMGIVGDSEEPEPAKQTKMVKKKKKIEVVKTRKEEAEGRVQSICRSFSFTDLILCVIAFLLFLLLITRN